ncbi:dipeptidase PepV [Cytobacillus sp. Hz8]|uniref:dipeptidase PepV n=1 Tax=Cytobacillus sp. Hz8 TaxID=3347168 RepID=UPI0035DCC096
MMSIDWMQEVDSRKESLIEDAKKLLKIKSVLNEEHMTPEAPLGKGVKEALDFMLKLGEKDGFTAKNVGNLAGHLEFGHGEELIGILCHVDVVPEGDGWTSDPYEAEIREGKIYARGAIDDKGPTMAAYYAMKIVKELGLPLNKRVRMIIGTDEESDWRCVDHYFENEEMPTMGFAPDADFPIIFAEKGISDFDLVQTKNDRLDHEGKTKVISFSSGLRYNMVPDFAKATIASDDLDAVKQKFENFLQEKAVKGQAQLDNGEINLEVEGKSAHGMEPEHGVNAGFILADFITTLAIDVQAEKYFEFISKYFLGDSRGKRLGVAYADDITGDLTINVGKMRYEQETGGTLGLNLRYPVTNEMDETKKKIESAIEKDGFRLENYSDSKPHHVDEKEFLIQTLKKVYEEQTGEKAELISIGGGTYARALKTAVAFGPLFPGRPDVAHQKDEYMDIEDLYKATAIYAQAIYELAK